MVWTVDLSFDFAFVGFRTLISESIARWLFPVHDFPDFAKLTERQYAFRARDRLRKSLSQLKEYMKCTERLMCHLDGSS